MKNIVKWIINGIIILSILYEIYIICSNYKENNYNETIISLLLIGLIIIVIIVIKISLLLHELGHIIASIFLGYKIQIFSLGEFKYVNNKKNKIFFDMDKIFYFNGFVIPQISSKINSEVDYNKLLKEYKRFIAAGILVTTSIIIISIFFIFIDELRLIALIIIILNCNILSDAFNCNDGKMGDIYILKLLMNNSEETIFMMSKNILLEYPKGSFIKRKLEDAISLKVRNKEYNLLLMEASIFIICEYIINNDILNKEFKILQKWLFESYKSIKNEEIIYKYLQIKLGMMFIIYDIKVENKTYYNKQIQLIRSFIENDKKLMKIDSIKLLLEEFKINNKEKMNFVKIVDIILFDDEIFKYSDKNREIRDSITR